MATVLRLLTPDEFHALYDDEKPYYEYWFGEAIQKAMPTWLHSFLQRLMVELLEQSGYYAGQEVGLRIASDWTPVPDVVGVTVIEQPYPDGQVIALAAVWRELQRRATL